MMDTDSKPIDVWMITFQRKELTKNAIDYFIARTKYPYRLFVIDNCSDDGTNSLLDDYEKMGHIYLHLRLSRNVGIHMAHNIGMSLVDSDLCVSTDNDIYVPDLEPCWLTQLVERMNNPKNRKYSAVACQPHVFLGAANLPKAEDGVHPARMAGAVMRIMRTNVIKKVGGWDRRFDANRNHEEKTISSRIQSIGGEVGYAEDIVCYHDFGDDNNWGYKEIHPHKHGHRIPGEEIWPTPEMLNNQNLDEKTWQTKN